jgi:hypothetical protein
MHVENSISLKKEKNLYHNNPIFALDANNSTARKKKPSMNKIEENP